MYKRVISHRALVEGFQVLAISAHRNADKVLPYRLSQIMARGPNSAHGSFLFCPLCSFGPQTSAFELSLALYCLPGKIIESLVYKY